MEHLHFASPILEKPAVVFSSHHLLFTFVLQPQLPALVSLATHAPKPCFQLLQRLEQLHK